MGPSPLVRGLLEVLELFPSSVCLTDILLSADWGMEPKKESAKGSFLSQASLFVLVSFVRG